MTRIHYSWPGHVRQAWSCPSSLVLPLWLVLHVLALPVLALPVDTARHTVLEQWNWAKLVKPGQTGINWCKLVY